MAKDALFSRLQRLRRESPARADAPPAPAPLDDLPTGDDPRGRTLGAPADLVERSGPAGAFAERVVRLAACHRHGDFALDEVAHACCAGLSTLTRDPGLARLDLQNAVYLDIETTGLGGGAGTIPFLVALGRFDGDGFELWQGFLRGPEEERALLLEVAERVGASSGVVSFFGKSFDRHRLEDKMRLHGVAPPFEGLPHLDLYHPCARLYRPAFDDGRLSTMERELCGVEREADLPGAFAPEAWYDFLAERAHLLEAVFRHNADDVLSLVTLAAHLGRTFVEERADGRALPGPAATRARALARLLAEERRRDEAFAWVERARERSAPDRTLEALRADLLRHLGRLDEARAGYEELCADESDELAAHGWLELAKLAEHRGRDLAAAVAACERAQRVLARVPIGRLHRRLSVDLAKRLERLRSKVGA